MTRWPIILGRFIRRHPWRFVLLALGLFTVLHVWVQVGWRLVMLAKLMDNM